MLRFFISAANQSGEWLYAQYVTEVTVMQSFDFSRTMQHPLAQRGLVEMVPTAWLASLANPEVTATTDLGNGTGSLVTASDLWEHMLVNGMRDPFIVTAGTLDLTTRLEAGNHRILLFIAHGIMAVPAVALIGESCVYHPGNGLHVFHKELLIDKATQSVAPYLEWRYAAPSKVFKELADLTKPERVGSADGMARDFLTKWGSYFWQDAVHGPVMHLLGQVSKEQKPGLFLFTDGSTIKVDAYRCFATDAATG